MAVLFQPGRKKSTATVDAVSEGTDALQCKPGETLSISIVGTYSGTVQLQRAFDGVNFLPVEDYTSDGSAATNTQKDIIVAAPLAYHLVMTARVSGSADLIIASSG